MKKVKSHDLLGFALDWAAGVAVGAYGLQVWHFTDGSFDVRFCEPEEEPDPRTLPYSPSTDWAQGGPLIEKYGVDLSAPPCIDRNREIGWQARPDDGETHWHSGETALVAAMRAIVTSKLGVDVDVPDILAKQ